MSVRSFMISLGAVCGLYCALGSSARGEIPGSITLDHVAGALNGDTIGTGTVSFFLRFTPGESPGLSNDALTQISFAFQASSPNGATWTGFVCDTIKSAYPNFQGYMLIEYRSADGQGSDTVFLFMAVQNSIDHNVWELPNDVVGFKISMNIPNESIGKTICIDSLTCAGSVCNWWLGGSSNGEPWYPTWDGPHCFTVASCCVGEKGGFYNPAAPANVLSLTGLTGYLFGGGQGPVCREEMDMDSNGKLNIIDVILVSQWLFQGGVGSLCP